MERGNILTELRSWIADIGLPAVLLFWILFRLDAVLNTWLPALLATQHKLNEIHTAIRRCCPPGQCPPCDTTSAPRCPLQSTPAQRI